MTLNRTKDLKYLFPPLHARVSPAEWRVRVDLAAAYRLSAHFGMEEMIRNHVSARTPDVRDAFLVKPASIRFSEVTASNLIKVGCDGKPRDDSPLPPDSAGVNIHGVVYEARDDIESVHHSHTLAGVAVSAQRDGLQPLSQHALRFYGRIAYHAYEGIALAADERVRIAADLGQARALILRHHGLLTAGRSVAEALTLMYYLDLACQVQLKAQASGAVLAVPPPQVCEAIAAQIEGDGRMGDEEWPALRRLADSLDLSYAS